MRPLKIPAQIRIHAKGKHVLMQRIGVIRAHLQKHLSAAPEISIVIPAYDEEESLLSTISSLASSSTSRSFEVIVVDNNSLDDTARLAELAGAVCVQEKKQGITAARNCGLRAARGIYVMNADADTIYPPDWIDQMIAPLEKQNAALTYGSHSFMPSADRRSVAYVVYEYIGDVKKWINRRFREEAVNVYGFNSAFRRMDGLAVDGFDHPPGTNEDGWLAVKLREHSTRSLIYVSDPQARVWTSNRRLLADGGLTRATVKRLFSH